MCWALHTPSHLIFLSPNQWEPHCPPMYKGEIISRLSSNCRSWNSNSSLSNSITDQLLTLGQLELSLQHLENSQSAAIIRVLTLPWFSFFQAHSVCVSSFTEVSPQTAEASALLAKAYAMSGDPQHKGKWKRYSCSHQLFWINYGKHIRLSMHIPKYKKRK